MIRTYYLTVEGEKDEILERHGNLMKQFKEIRKGHLDLTIGFDERNVKKEIGKGAMRILGHSGRLVGENLSKGLAGLSK